MTRYKVSYFGDFTQLSLRELLLSLEAQQETGALYVRRERVLKKIFLKRGKPNYVQSNVIRDESIRYLYDRKRVDLNFLNRLFEESKEPGDDLVNLLLRSGSFSQHEFYEYERQRIRSIIIDLLRWPEGSYLYLFDRALPEGVDAGWEPIEPKEVIQELMQQNLDAGFLRSYFNKRLDRRPILKDSENVIQERLSLSPAQKRFLHLIDGEKDVETLALGSGGKVETTFNWLLLLETFGFIEYQQAIDGTPVDPPSYGSTDLGVEGMALMNRLKDYGAHLLEKAPFELLGISRVFTEEDLRKGYYTIAQNFHQKDIVDKLPPDLKKLSYQIFEWASTIFEALVVWEKKRLGGEFNIFSEMEVQCNNFNRPANLEAEILFFKGQRFLKNNDPSAALSAFSRAHGLEPNENEYRAWKAWTMFRYEENHKSASAKTAFAEIRKAVAEDPMCVAAQLLYAQTLEKEGHGEEAQEIYRQTLVIAPGSPEALAGLKRTRPILTMEELDEFESETERDLDQEHRFRHLLKRMETVDYFTILGLDRTASPAAIKAKYFELAKQYHPDNYKNTKLLMIAEKIFILINEAYDVLSNKKKRVLYERSLRAIDTQKSQIDLERKLSDDRLMQKGMAFLQSNNWGAAADLFEKAMAQTESPNLRCQLYHTWAVFNRDIRQDPTIREKAESIFLQIVQQDPKLVDLYIIRGKFYRKLEIDSRALTQFEHALTLDPDNIEALREIRLIKQRSGTTEKHAETAAAHEGPEERKGLLRSFWGKKKK